MKFNSQVKGKKRSFWVLRCTIFFYLCIFVKSKENQRNDYQYFDYEYFDTFSRSEIKEEFSLDSSGEIQHVNISFPNGGKSTFLFLEPDTPNSKKSSFLITKISASGKHLSEQEVPKNCLIGYVKDVAQKAFALFFKSHWFVAFGGSDGMMYSMEPELRQGIPDNTAQTTVIYHIFKIKGNQSRGSDDLNDMGKPSNPTDDQNAESKPVYDEFKRKYEIHGKTDVQGKQLKEKRQDKNLNNSPSLKLPVPQGDSFSKHVNSDFIDADIQTSDKRGQKAHTAPIKSPCNVLVVTDTTLWRRLGVEDAVVAASLYMFGLQHVNQMIWQSGSRNQEITSLKIEHIYIYDNDVPGALDTEHENKFRGGHTPTRRDINVSDILCKLRSDQRNNKYCLTQAIVAYGRAGAFGATQFADEGLTKTFPTNSKHDSYGSKTRNMRFIERFKNAPEPRDQPRSFTMNTVQGCHQEALPIGLFLHFLSRQLTQSIRSEISSPDSSRLTCGLNKADAVKLRAEHSKLDMEECRAVYAKTNMSRATRRHQSSEMRHSRTKRDKQITKQTCGDGKINQGEECDPGHQPCCTRDCRIAPPTHICKSVVSKHNECIKVTTFCNGVDPTLCSGSGLGNLSESKVRFTNVPDSSRCGKQSVCLDGECMPVCDEWDVRQSNGSHELTICDCSKWQTGDELAREKCADCCNEFKSANACVLTQGPGADESLCVFNHCPKLGCIQVEAKPFSHKDEDFMGVSFHGSGKDKGSPGVISTETLSTILRVTYWLLSGGVVSAFFTLTVVTVLPFCGKNDTKPKRKRSRATTSRDTELEMQEA